MKIIILFITILSVNILFTGCQKNIEQKLSEIDTSITKEQEPVIGRWQQSIIDQAEESLDTNYISVKYRTSLVDIDHKRFEYLNTSKSLFVRGSWYDEVNEYMIIKLNTVYYHYCGLPSNTWNSFQRAASFGTFYNKNIKIKYDCRSGDVPTY
jgi:hypothetical protein